jgi:serpin B
MNKVMFAGLTDEQINESLNEVFKVVNEPTDAYVLRTANRLYIEKSYDVLQSYLDVVRKHFQSDCIPSDFKGKPQEVVQEVNSWVEKITNDKIKDLVPVEAVNGDTRLILVNAIYFKGDWKNPFEEAKTVKKPFHVSQNKTVDVDMMHAKLKTFKFTATDTCQVLGIPYKSQDLAMFFVLPTTRNGLQALEKELTGPALIELIHHVYTTEVEVQLPKFKLEKSFDLVEKLGKLGMTDMFSCNADFSKISGSKDLCVSNVVHKAFIEVNEKGAEAAAATAVVMASRCGPMPSQRFIADHPFLFALFERKTSSILFLGHYYGQ